MCPLFCGVWDNSKGYEALSVVTHNGEGYTSNKPITNQMAKIFIPVYEKTI